MLSNSFNLIDHSCVSLLLECQQQGVKITNVGIFASGLLCVAPAACASLSRFLCAELKPPAAVQVGRGALHV